MSICLAQSLPTTQPATLAMAVLSFLVMAGGLPLSIYLLRRHRTLAGITRPRSPEEGPANAMIGVALLIGYAVQILVLTFAVKFMGLDPKATDFPRHALTLQPLALSACIVAVILFLQLAHPCQARVLQLDLSRPRRDLRIAGSSYALVLPWVLLANVIAGLLAQFFGQQPDSMHAVFESWGHESSGLTLTKTLLFTTAVIFAPLAEEILFRGLLQRFILNLVRYPIVAVILTSLAFAAIHNPWQLRPAVFVLSLGLGWAYLRTGSLLCVVFFHALFNLVNFTLFLVVLAP